MDAAASLARPARALPRLFSGRGGFLTLALAYGVLVLVCLGSLAHSGDLSLGRNPLANLLKTAGEFASPSFLDVWLGDPQLGYRSDDGTLLRTENRQDVEADYLRGLARATFTTVSIATLGSLLGAPRVLAWLAKGVLDPSVAANHPLPPPINLQEPHLLARPRRD